MAPASVRIGLVVSADFGSPAGKVDIGAAKALADIDRGEPRRLQPVRIERDQNFALYTADALDLGDTPRTPCSARLTTSSTK